MKISVVIPLLNEEENVAAVAGRVRQALEPRTSDYEIIFVDDGSTDRSLQRIRELSSTDPRIKAISFSRNFGQQYALTAGIDHSSGDAVILMDADLQHPPELIPRMLDKWAEGFDVVYMQRKRTEREGLVKRLTAQWFYRLFRRLTGVSVPESTSDFRLLDRKVIAAVRRIRERTRFLRALTTWAGYRTCGLTYVAAARVAGESKYGFGKMLALGLDAIVSFSTVPLHLSIYLGFALAIAGGGYGIFALYARFVTGQVIRGWTSFIMVSLMLGGIQLVMLGIFGAYLGKVYNEVKQRPLYLIKDAIGVETKSGEWCS